LRLKFSGGVVMISLVKAHTVFMLATIWILLAIGMGFGLPLGSFASLDQNPPESDTVAFKKIVLAPEAQLRLAGHEITGRHSPTTFSPGRGVRPECASCAPAGARDLIDASPVISSPANLWRPSGTEHRKAHFSKIYPYHLSLPFALRLKLAPQEARPLEPGQAIERALSGGEIHAYRVALKAKQFMRVTADQRGIDVALKLFGPDGKQLIEVDTFSERGLEQLRWVAEVAGDYRVEAGNSEKSAARASYQLNLEELRDATAQDLNRVAGQRVFIEAGELSYQGNAESRRQAVEKYLEALSLWRGTGERTEEATTLYHLGDTHRGLTEYPKAIEYLNQALGLWRAAGNRYQEAVTLNTLGAAYYGSGDREKASEYYLQALPLRREVKDRRGEAIALNSLGVTYADLGEKRKALDYYQQALPLRREIKDRAGEAITLNGIGLAYRDLGEKQKALKFYEQALLLRREIKDRAGEAVTLSNIGVLYDDLGEAQKALDAFGQALPLRRDARGRAVTLNNIGRAYDNLGAPQEALSYYNQSLALMRSASDKRGEAQTLNFMGLAYWTLGEYEQALEYFKQALPLRREVKDRAGEGATLNNLGLVYDSLNEPRKAIGVYQPALPLFRAVGDRQSEARVLNNLGFAHDTLGDKAKARDHHNRALHISRAVGDRAREAKVRYGLARIERDQDRLRQARGQIEKTIEIIESQRAKLASPELRAAYRASVQRYYEFQIDLLMRLHKRQPSSGFAARALETSERARARSLLELLTEAGADLRQGVAPEPISRERELQQQLNDKAVEQIRLLNGKHTEEQAAAASDELTALTLELRDVQASIRRDSPRYAALTQPQPLSARAIQQQVLDANTLLLEYALGEDRSYLWAVTQTTLRSYTLPARGKIEAAARQFYELLTTRNQTQTKTAASTKQARLPEADARCAAAGAALSNMLLGPVASQLGNKRLLVVTEGALQYVPFAALPAPQVRGGRKKAQEMQSKKLSPSAFRLSPLIVEHEIISLPSASTLAVLRNETAGRRTATKVAAVLADPVFESQDERLKTIALSGAKNPEETEKRPEAQHTPDVSRILLYKSSSAAGAADDKSRIPRLPYTRREAEAILSLVPPEVSKSAFDFAASRAAMMSDELSQYRILHLATHGFLNSAQPELSGLVLSMVNEKGAPQNGFLLAPEIYNLRLPSTELVVLSACQTGLGKEIKGEGLVGLTRGFMYAGAPRVVVSLWSVSDQATAELMTRFYQGMLNGKLSPAAALRAAQVSLWKEKNWQAPYYWAAFALQGEWR
jgi:CHAT domain-containing protein/uncharacterized protein HemY